MKCVALMVEIVVTTSQDGMLGARIADARRNAKMANMVPVLIGVLKILFQKILVKQVAAHLVELVCLVDKFAKEDVRNVMRVHAKMLEAFLEKAMIFVHRLKTMDCVTKQMPPVVKSPVEIFAEKLVTNVSLIPYPLVETLEILNTTISVAPLQVLDFVIKTMVHVDPKYVENCA